MKKQDKLRRRLQGVDGTAVEWPEYAYLPAGRYTVDETVGIRLDLTTEYGDDYALFILPGDGGGTYDAWLRRRGGTDLVHILTKRSKDPESIVKAALKLLPEYCDMI